MGTGAPKASIIHTGHDGITVIVATSTYVLPGPSSDSEANWRRLYHFDLANASPLRLWAEKKRAEVALSALVCAGEDICLEREPSGREIWAQEWLVGRLHLVEARLREEKKARS